MVVTMARRMERLEAEARGECDEAMKCPWVASNGWMGLPAPCLLLLLLLSRPPLDLAAERVLDSESSSGRSAPMQLQQSTGQRASKPLRLGGPGRQRGQVKARSPE